MNTIYRCILPDWASEPGKKKVLEGQFNQDQIIQFNEQFYNIYYLPNYPSHYNPSVTVDGTQIDTFNYVFVDMDLKDKKYDKDSFIEKLGQFSLPPTLIIDSGNGIHAYWKVSDLTAMSFLKLQRRLILEFQTDEAVGQIFQLMRTPGTVNTKHEDNFKLCRYVKNIDSIYTSEQLDKELPALTQDDENYCVNHYNKTYNIDRNTTVIEDTIPIKFAHLLRSNNEAKTIWSGGLDDRSKGDYRLAHIMFAHNFTKEEASSVLINSAKALARAPVHRISYATNIIDKIWVYESKNDELSLSSSVEEILNKSGHNLKGTRFSCWNYLDNTEHGFRLGQVIGLVAGSGVGKTAIALNMFEGFVKNNPDYDHFFVPLEQPHTEIADRWQKLCGENTQLHKKVHIMKNYDDNGNFVHLSLDEIKDYVIRFQQITKRKIGCVVIDHIGALKKKSKDGENQGLMDVCHEMKSFAIQTNTMLVMQSQAPREKAGIGDLELSKDAAYGTVYFESYCDYLITLWQPLKRCYKEEGCPTVTAFKFCKIRHKNQGVDKIQEDVPYMLFFDPKYQRLREMTQDEEKSFDFFNNKATNKRKLDRKTDLVTYTSLKIGEQKT